MPSGVTFHDRRDARQRGAPALGKRAMWKARPFVTSWPHQDLAAGMSHAHHGVAQEARAESSRYGSILSAA